MPFISVIVPVYNSEKTLHRCVDSILAQSFSDFELLLIDDGSVDGSGAICDDYARRDSRVRVFHKQNGGVSSARNVGLDNSTGRWITFCDSDDRVYNNWLDLFADKGNEDTDLIVQGFETDKGLFPDTCVTQYGISYTGNVDEGLQILSESFTAAYLWNKAFKTSLIKEHRIRFNESLKYKEDKLFVLEYCSRANIIVSVVQSGYYYYVPDRVKKYTLSASYLEAELESLELAIDNDNIKFLKRIVPWITDDFINAFRVGANSIMLSRRMRRIMVKLKKRNYPLDDNRKKVVRTLLLADPTCVVASLLISLIFILRK